MIKSDLYARFSAILRSNSYRGHIHGSSSGHPWMHNLTKTYWKVLNIIKFIIKRFRASYVTSRDDCVFFSRDFVRKVIAKRSWTLGTSLSRLHQDMHALTYRLRRLSWQNEGNRLISGLPGRIKARGPRTGKTRGRLRHGLSRHRASTPAPQK